MRQWAIRSANVVLFVLGCFVAAQIVVSVLAEVAVPDEAIVSAITPVVHTGARTSGAQDRQSILERNLFGAQLTGESAETAEPEPEQIEAVETKLPLNLLGTVASDDPRRSNAAIMDRGTRKHQVVFVGDKLDNHPRVEVVEILRGTVILQNGPKRERLDLHDEDAAAGNRSRTAAAPRRATARSRRGRRPSIQERMAQLPDTGTTRTTASLYSQARIIPEWNEGEMVGVRLNQVKPGSLYEKIGIESGDVITSLNGISIDSPQASSRLLTELTQAEQFEIELKDGETINVPPEELQELLGE